MTIKTLALSLSLLSSGFSPCFAQETHAPTHHDAKHRIDRVHRAIQTLNGHRHKPFLEKVRDNPTKYRDDLPSAAKRGIVPLNRTTGTGDTPSNVHPPAPTKIKSDKSETTPKSAK